MAKGKSAGVVPKQNLKQDFYSGEKSNVARETEDKTDGFKRGGKAKREARKHGGNVMSHTHHEKPEHMKYAKDVGKVQGGSGMNHGGKAPRKSGGGVFSSAHSGSARKPSSHY